MPTVKELRAELEIRGLDTSGLKAALARRLEEDKAQPPTPPSLQKAGWAPPPSKKWRRLAPVGPGGCPASLRGPCSVQCILCHGGKSEIIDMDPNTSDIAAGASDAAKAAASVVITEAGDPVELSVVAVDGSDLKLDMFSGSTVLDIKKLVQNRKGVPIDDSQLFTGESEKPISLTRTLAECGLAQGGTVFLIVETSGFIGSQAFTGPKPEYQFTTGPRGLGYYKIDSELKIGASHLEFKIRLRELKKKRGY